MKNKVIEIVNNNCSNELAVTENKTFIRGMVDLRVRLKHICELALNEYDGDILEIGAHIGRSSLVFAELAKKYNRKLIVIDPWDGRQQGNEDVYQKFLTNTQEYEDVIETHRLDSTSEEAISLIQSNKFAFCWVDGLHTVEACSSDIDACSTQKGIIAVDDLSWSPGLENLFENKATQYKFEKYYNPTCREGYLISE